MWSKKIVETRLTLSLDPIFINKNVFESMPEEYQKVLEESAAEFFNKNVQFLAEQDETVEEELAKLGIEVIHLSDEEFKTLNESVQAAVWPTIEANFGKDFMDGVKKDVGLS